MRINKPFLAALAFGGLFTAALAQPPAQTGSSEGAQAAKERAERRAAAIDAERLRLIARGELSARDATPAELKQLRKAGARAGEPVSRIAGK